MPTVLIIAIVCIIIVLLIPGSKKKGNGTDVLGVPSMRAAQFADYIRRKLKDLIGD